MARMDDHFNIEEAEEILPEVAFLVEEAVAVSKELKEAYSNAFKIKSSTAGMSEKLITHNFSQKNKKKIRMLTEELNDILEEVEDIGVIFKDIDGGIVDFPSKFQGKDVMLCWKLGEERIEHWHEEDGSFKGRKKILRLE